MTSELNFLSEKFAPAVLPEVYAPRHALLGAFHRAAENRFIYVGAPAGSGKTLSTLLWLRASGRKTVWIGLDQYDSTLSVFYKQLATGLFSTQPENAAMQEILLSPSFSASPVEHTVRLLAEMLPDDRLYALVLDDMHLIQNGEVLKALPAILRRLPRNFVTLVLSRHEIPEEFEDMVREGHTGLITPEHLRFSEDEIRQYFGSLGRFLTPEEAHTVFLATEGWAIGVNAVAQSGEIEEGGGHVFARYFETQIWDKWERPLREFCLSTAIVDEFDPELARDLSGREDAQAVMETLSRTNSFLSRLHGDTYRYHHLFQDFLRDRLGSSGADLSALYKKAANYYKAHDDYSRALRFWLGSGDYKGTDSFLYLFLFKNHRGVVADYAEFLRSFAIEEFPERAYRESPALHVLSAWYYYLTSYHEEYARHMDAIIRNLPRIAKAGSEFAEFSVLAFSVDHRVSMRKKIQRYGIFGRFIKKYTPEGLATNIASFTHNLPYMHRSNLDYSELALDPGIIDGIDKTFAPLLGAEWTYLRPGLEACFAYERNDLPEALTKNEQAKSLLDENSKIEGRICVFMLWHSILWQMGKEREAEAAMDELSALVDSSAQFFIPNLAAYQAKLQLFDGDADAAREWLDRYFVVETDHIELFRAFQHFTTARACMVSGDVRQAEAYLLMLKEYGQNLNRPLDECEARTLLAALYWAQGQKKEAAAELGEALAILQPYHFLRVVADEGAAILPVLKRIAAGVNRAEYSGSLDRAFVNEALLSAHAFSKRHKGIAANLGQAGGEKPVKLSRQQRLMLKLLSQGYRNAEICEIAGLRLPTVKTHLSLAYQKLGVNNAMDAVLRARELNLLE